ncbi:hypothetical protein Arno162_142 [Pectobacterium phage Arno162]|uniref:Uncharacterized protein n=2 Tax=Arnovirus TaxID=3425109 RepID=A0A678ZK73_9CAUD|nr:hypothetical protein Arno162_142 [Pectobacterium phage Arno162]AZV02328.1 hypothetical protein Arno18_142 [Pectobacterium phage Arno18]
MVKVIRKEDNETIACSKCKGVKWVSLKESSTHCKAICNTCWNGMTLYLDSEKYILEQVK